MKTAQQINKWLVSYMAKLQAVQPDEIDTTMPFHSYGIDSTAAAGLTGDLGRWLGIELESSVAFDHPTIEELSKYASQRLSEGR